jgi:transposase
MGPYGFCRREGGGGGGAAASISLPYSSELNPAERVLKEVRLWVEGRRYERIQAKKAAVEAALPRLEAEGKVPSLVGWRYVRQALNALPS